MKAALSTSHSPGGSDFSTIESAQRQLAQASEELSGMTESVAKARQVREFHSDRLKRALAVSVREFLAAGDSATAADTKGRASVAYGEALDQLSIQYGAAEAVIAKWEATRIHWESARSILSSLRAIVSNV